MQRCPPPEVPHYNLARFDFVSIRLAVACARTGSLTEAARECHLVLPAASRRLRDLERALGGPLFERHSRGVTPTALGRAFMKRGMAILQELDNLLIELAETLQAPVDVMGYSSWQKFPSWHPLYGTGGRG